MPRIYAVPFSGTVTSAGADTDLFSLQPADDRPIRLRGFRLGQTTEVGDTAEEGLRITVRRMTATYSVGSGGSSITAIAPIGDAGGSAWSFTARANDTSVSTTTGSNQVLDELGWVNRNTPYETWYPDTDYAPRAKQTEAIVIRMETTLADDMTFTGCCWIEED